MAKTYKNCSRYDRKSYLTIKKGDVTMARVKGTMSSNDKSRRIRPALTPEVRENQMISLAVDLTEQQLREGTASSQVISHFLKLGSSKERLEKEKLEEENKLLRAKTENLKTMKNIEELYSNAIKAMKTYSGQSDDYDE